MEGRLCENSDMLGLGRAMFATLFHAGPSQAAYQQCEGHGARWPWEGPGKAGRALSGPACPPACLPD